MRSWHSDEWAYLTNRTCGRRGPLLIILTFTISFICMHEDRQTPWSRRRRQTGWDRVEGIKWLLRERVVKLSCIKFCDLTAVFMKFYGNVQPRFLQEFIERIQSHLSDWLLGALADRKRIWHWEQCPFSVLARQMGIISPSTHTHTLWKLDIYLCWRS